ncbi:MAG: glycosyltransferase, partial [Anaerolineae bacterium]
MPKLSLITLCYNQAPFLLERIRSIRAQTFQDFEWIVIDDCSTDDSAYILQRELGTDPRVKKLIFHERNLGAHPSFNEAISLCEGEYVYHAAGDDSCSPRLFHREIETLDASPNVAFVHTAYRVIDREGHTVKEVFPYPHDCVHTGVEEFKQLIRFRYLICSASVMFRLASYREVGGISNDLIFAGDSELWLLFAAHYDVAYIAEPLMYWRRHPNALSAHSIVTPEGATEYYRMLDRLFTRISKDRDDIQRLRRYAIRYVSTYWMPGIWAWWLMARRSPRMALRIFLESVRYDPGFLFDVRTPLYLADNFGRRLIRR